MTDPLSPRRFLGAGGAGLALAGASMVSDRARRRACLRPTIMPTQRRSPAAHPKVGPDYQPVVTLNGGRCRGG